MPTLTAYVLGSLLLAAASPDWANAPTVTIVETEYGFKPSQIVLRVGTAYRLRFENQGKELHEFTAPAFLKTIEIRNPEALNADRTEVVLQPGEQKDLFLVARQAGHYPFVCADHDWAGMTGEVVVE
ncbi:MAG TPA: cupredoxin domain-containing protein [Candidatus Methylomirabilis sp.]|nr:cupredoxin domain-containing protein [Candidatus Methylomirabilis sp.]